MGTTKKELVDSDEWLIDTKEYGDLISMDSDMIDLDDILDTSTISIVDPYLFNDKNKKPTVEDRLDKIEQRLSILEPKQELLDKYELLQSLYEQYKAAEAMLSGPDIEDEKD